MILSLLSLLLAADNTTPTLRTFDRVQLLEEKGETSAGVQAGDVNGDGRIDIVLGKGRHWPLHDRVLINNGKGGFTASNLGAAPDRTYSAALVDLDRDGDPDIVVSNDYPDRKLLYKNDGKGNFSEAGSFGEPKWPTRYVTLADLNGDQFPDIIAANRGSQSHICMNDRKGGFPACQAIPSQSATSIVASDLDGDGAIDLFVPHRDGGQSQILWNDGKANFPNVSDVGPAKAWMRIGAAGDFDGDGKLDLAVIDERQKAAYTMANLGGRKFGDLVALPGVAGRVPYALAVQDLNKDKRVDIVVGWVERPGSVYFNLGKGEFHEVAWNDGKGVVYGIAFADWDGDGWLDIAAARSDAPNGIWFSTKK